MEHQQLLHSVAAIAQAAGQEILKVYDYHQAMQVSYKEDASPLTDADRRAHELIVARLTTLTPAVPVLSEESDSTAFAMRKTWSRYWLVDPLDGTTEFIKHNGEFTVNIALIEDGRATLGVVHVPVSAKTYSGSLELGARVSQKDRSSQPIRCKALAPSRELVRVVTSRSHRDRRVDKLIQMLQSEFGIVEQVSMGSSLKICLLAEGQADIYPRLASTCEWDTAAAHAVLSAAGGEIFDTNFMPLLYNQKDSLLNPFFIALADSAYAWQSLLADCLQE